MAAADRFWVNITGRGGHAAMPHLSIDPVVAASQVGSDALLAHAAPQSLLCRLNRQAVKALLAGACLRAALGIWVLTCWGQILYVGTAACVPGKHLCVQVAHEHTSRDV